MPLDATLSARGLALARLGPYLGPKPQADPGVLTIDTTAKGAFLGALRLAGNVTFVPRGGRDARSRIPAIDGRFRGVLDWPHATLTLEPSSVSVARLPLTIRGRIDGLRAKPRLDLEMATQGEVPAERVTALPAVAAALPPGVRLSGRVRLTALLRGPAGDLAVHGIRDAAPLRLSRDGEEGPLLAAPTATATLESIGRGPALGAPDDSLGPLKRLHFENLRADWSWDTGTGNPRVAPEADVFGGRIAARLESELGKAEPLSRATVELDGVRGDALVEAATTTRNAFAGAITGRLSLGEPRALLGGDPAHREGEGHVTVSGPNLYTVHVKPEVASMLATIGKYAAGFLTPPSLESTTFERLDTSLRLADGQLATPDLTLSRPRRRDRRRRLARSRQDALLPGPCRPRALARPEPRPRGPLHRGCSGPRRRAVSGERNDHGSEGRDRPVRHHGSRTPHGRPAGGRPPRRLVEGPRRRDRERRSADAGDGDAGTAGLGCPGSAAAFRCLLRPGISCSSS